MLSQPPGLITQLLFCQVGVLCFDGVTSCRRVWSCTLSRGAFRDLKLLIFILGHSGVTMCSEIRDLVSFHLSISLLWIVLWSYFIISRAPDKVSISPHSSLSLFLNLCLSFESRVGTFWKSRRYIFFRCSDFGSKNSGVCFSSKILFNFSLRS